MTSREQIKENIEYYKNVIKTQAGKVGIAQEAIIRAEVLIKKLQKDLDKLDEPVVKHGDIIRDGSTTAIVVGGFKTGGWPYGKNGFVAYYIGFGNKPTENDAEYLVRSCGYKVVGNIKEQG